MERGRLEGCRRGFLCGLGMGGSGGAGRFKEGAGEGGGEGEGGGDGEGGRGGRVVALVTLVILSGIFGVPVEGSGVPCCREMGTGLKSFSKPRRAWTGSIVLTARLSGFTSRSSAL